MDRLNKEYIELLSEDIAPSEKFSLDVRKVIYTTDIIGF